MPKGGGQKSTGTQTVKQEPADFVKPFYTQAAQESQNLYNTYRPEFFGGSTYVPFSPETELALQAQTQRAIGGSPLMDEAQNQQLRTIRGDYLTGSPQLEQELNRISGRVNSQFAGGGGYRSSANQEVLAREMSDAALRNYQSERGLQQQAIGAAPQMALSDYADIGQLANVGQTREDLFGRQLQEQMDYFNFLQEQDPAALDQYIGRITALGGGMNSQNTTGMAPGMGRNALGTGLGLAQQGLGLYNGLTAAGILGSGSVLGSAAAAGGSTAPLFTGLAAISSDERLKTKIKLVGKENGHNIYEFAYKTDPDKKFIGVMAQEVKETQPDAVEEINGFLAVDYDKIGVAFREV